MGMQRWLIIEISSEEWQPLLARNANN